MDRKYIIEHNLMEAHKHFMHLSEGYLATSLSEDDEEQNQEETPSMDIDNQDTQGQDMTAGGNENQMNGQPGGDEMQTDTNEPEGDFGMEPLPTPGTDSMEDEGEDEDVLDVDDLTQAQERLNKKQNSLGHDLGEVDDRIIALLTAVEKIQGSIEKNNSDITALKKELEKRVPTDTEKLNMQSLKMYPFNVSPNEYWKDKEKDGRYEAEGKDDKKEYKITNDDVDNYTEREIENSFDDELNQTMKDIFKGF